MAVVHSRLAQPRKRTRVIMKTRAEKLVREFGETLRKEGVDHFAIIVRDPDELTDHVRTDGSNVWLMGAGMEIIEGAKEDRMSTLVDNGDDDDDDDEDDDDEARTA